MADFRHAVSTSTWILSFQTQGVCALTHGAAIDSATNLHDRQQP